MNYQIGIQGWTFIHNSRFWANETLLISVINKKKALIFCKLFQAVESTSLLLTLILFVSPDQSQQREWRKNDCRWLIGFIARGQWLTGHYTTEQHQRTASKRRKQRQKWSSQLDDPCSGPDSSVGAWLSRRTRPCVRSSARGSAKFNVRLNLTRSANRKADFATYF